MIYYQEIGTMARKKVKTRKYRLNDMKMNRRYLLRKNPQYSSHY